MRRFMPVALTLYIAFVFIQSLFFKFTDSPETQYIFGTLDLWGASLGWPGLFAHDGIFSQYVVGTGELIASALVLAGLIERLRILRPIGALMAMGVISGAIFFHLFTPLGVAVVNTELVTAVELAQRLERITADIMWFNPAVWLIRRELDVARELACDEGVVEPVLLRAVDRDEHRGEGAAEGEQGERGGRADACECVAGACRARIGHHLFQIVERENLGRDDGAIVHRYLTPRLELRCRSVSRKCPPRHDAGPWGRARKVWQISVVRVSLDGFVTVDRARVIDERHFIAANGTTF